MEKGKGEGGRRETVKEEAIPYRSRLISLQLDEHMFRGPGEFADNSLIRLFSNDRLAAQIKNPGLVWIFKDWRIEKGHNRITYWRNLSAVCYNTRSNKTKELPVLYQQWGLTGLNAHYVSAPDYTEAPPGDIPGATKSIIESIFDIIDVVKSEKVTDDISWNNKMTIENGNDVCDKLNLYWRKP